MRWSRASRWAHPLSVVQHSLTVIAIREAEGPLTTGEALRELLHDGVEFMLGWDCIAPLKAQLGKPIVSPPPPRRSTVGWSRRDIVEALGIEISPLLNDPLPRNRFLFVLRVGLAIPGR